MSFPDEEVAAVLNRYGSVKDAAVAILVLEQDLSEWSAQLSMALEMADSLAQSLEFLVTGDWEPVADFFVLGSPVAKERPRITGHGNYTPQATHDHQERVAWAFRQQCREPFDPESRFKIEMWAGVLRLNQDVDNLAKTVMDGLIGLAYRDDRQVDELIVHRERAADRPGTKIAISKRGAR